MTSAAQNAKPALSATNRARLAAVVVAAAIVSGIGWAAWGWMDHLLSPPTPSVAPSAPDLSLKGASDAVRTVQIDGPWLDIRAELRTEDASGYVDLAAGIADALAKRFHDGPSDKTAAVRDMAITFVSPDGVRLVTVGFDAAKLRADDLDHLGPYSILGLTNHVMFTDQRAVLGVGVWCAKHYSLGLAFCRTALQK